jgi:anti-anti-sigma regulatory factor
MLMITRQIGEQGLTLRLEGQLAGAWVTELAATWSSILPCLSEKSVLVDLAGVTFIDAQGLEILNIVARQGAAIVAPGSLNQDLVEEINMSLRSR